MADNHRRRRVKSDDDSEKSFSESDVEVEDSNELETTITDTPEKEPSTKVAEGSEYESAEEEKEIEEKHVEKEEIPSENLEDPKPKDEESIESEVVDEEGGEEGIAETEEVEGDFLSGDANDESDEDEEEEDYVEEERQQGDGEECSPSSANEKELDFDEDRRNPQYIPKKGIFYEHDDRNNEDIKEKEEEPPRDRKKKLWLDEGKWGHDRFREEEQFPKSRNELIEAYGYDIRNEDCPPRARRRRRYGRGPTKYERNWEDVQAYGREKFKGDPDPGTPRGRRGGRFRGGPRFRGAHSRNENEELNVPEEVPVENEGKDDEAVDNTPVINNNEFPALPTKESAPLIDNPPPEDTYFDKNSPVTESKSVRTLTFENSNFGNRNSTEREVPSRPRGKTPPFSTRGSRRPGTRGSRGMGRGDYVKRGRGNMRHVSPRFLEKNANLNSEMEQLSLEANVDNSDALHHNDSVLTNSNGPELPSIALKGGGDSAGRPKRYSSLRQRSLPETNAYQTPPQSVPPPTHPYYEAGYQTTLYAPSDTCVPTPSTQSQTVTSTPIMNPTAYQTFTPPSYTDSYGLRMPVNAPPPRLFPQVNVTAPQPLLAAQPIIAPTPNIMSFAPPPPHAGYQQLTYQQFTTPPPPPIPAPPSDMYQPGITYYYPQSQAPAVRPTVQKRPKAAIPILPPPEREPKQSEKKDISQSNSNGRNFSENSSEAAKEVQPLRTDASSQLQPTVGVES